MKNLFSNEESSEFTTEELNVPVSTLFRWALYDMSIKNPNRFAEAAGFTPISKEGEEMEKRESEERLAKLVPYTDFIDLMASIAGEIIAESFAGLLSKYDIPELDIDSEEEKTLMFEMNTLVALHAIIPTLSAGIELGILSNPNNFLSGEYYE